MRGAAAEPETAGQVLTRSDATVDGADAATLANDLALKRLTVLAVEAFFGNRLFVDGPLAFSHQSGSPHLGAQEDRRSRARRR